MNKTFLFALLGLVTICRPSFGATDQSPHQQISYQCFIIVSDKPIPHDLSKLSHRKGIDVMSAPVARGRIGQQLSVKVVEQLIPEYVHGLKDTERLETGLSIFLKGTLDQNKIILIGRLRILAVVDRNANAESTSLATVSKDLYFSKIVENGEESWFDVHDPDQKAQYTTVRIVPSLLP